MLNSVTFESLSPFYGNTNFLELMREISEPIIENKSDTSKLKSVLDLRRLRKHHYYYFNKVFDNISNAFLKMIKLEPINDELLIECLKLIRDVFSGDNDHISTDMGDWLRLYVPIILKFSIGQHTKSIAYEILNNITNFMLFPETIEAFIDEIIFSENEEKMDFAANFVMKNLENFDEITIENSVYWDTCLTKLVEVYERRSEKWQIFVRRVFLFVSHKLGQTRFEEIMKENSVNDEVNGKMRRIFEESKRLEGNVS
jgi:hypothetical protein